MTVNNILQVLVSVKLVHAAYNDFGFINWGKLNNKEFFWYNSIILSSER